VSWTLSAAANGGSSNFKVTVRCGTVTNLRPSLNAPSRRIELGAIEYGAACAAAAPAQSRAAATATSAKLVVARLLTAPK
jgi:hypothetical protein